MMMMMMMMIIVMKRKHCNSDRHRLAYNNTDSSSTHDDFIRLLQINRNRLFLLLLSWDLSLITIHYSAVQCNMIDMSRICYTVTMF